MMTCGSVLFGNDLLFIVTNFEKLTCLFTQKTDNIGQMPTKNTDGFLVGIPLAMITVGITQALRENNSIATPE